MTDSVPRTWREAAGIGFQARPAPSPSVTGSFAPPGAGGVIASGAAPPPAGFVGRGGAPGVGFVGPGAAHGIGFAGGAPAPTPGFVGAQSGNAATAPWWLVGQADMGSGQNLLELMEDLEDGTLDGASGETPAPKHREGIWADGGEESVAPSGQGVLGTLGAPSGTIPQDLGIAYGRGASWDRVNRHDPSFLEAAETYGIRPSFLKAIAVVETGGENIRNQNGNPWGGVMQIHDQWADEAAAEGIDIATDHGQIMWAAKMLREHMDANPGATEEDAFRAVYYPVAGGPNALSDDGHTQNQYLADVAAIEGMINSAAPIGGTSSQPGAPAAAPAAPETPGLAAIWGGTEAPVAIEFGEPPPEGANPRVYDYGTQYGAEAGANPGMDIALAVGTPLAAPISGTVVSVGGMDANGVQGARYFSDPNGVGEVRIQAENGDILVLGYLRSADVKPGDQIAAGDLVGTSGQADSRPESALLHVEVRTLQGDGSYLVADPEQYIDNAQRSGTHPSGVGDPTGQAIADLADDYVNVPYIYGSVPTEGMDPWKTGWDCSGFVYHIADRMGLSDADLGPGVGVPRGSHYQAQWAVDQGRYRPNRGAGYQESSLQPGDLLFFDTGADGGGGQTEVGPDAARATHVGIYLGDGKMINAMQECAPGLTNGVDCGTGIIDLNDSYWAPRFIGSANMVPTNSSPNRQPPANKPITLAPTVDPNYTPIGPGGEIAPPGPAPQPTQPAGRTAWGTPA